MENNKLLNVIAVDCTYNDPVDIKAGGSKILGYDFYVLPEETEELMKFIQVSIEKLEIPLQSIYVKGQINSNSIWNKERILAALVKDAEYLKHEASRNYKPMHK